MINLSKSGISTDTYSPVTRFKMNNPVPQGQVRDAFMYDDKVVFATAPKSNLMPEVRDLFQMGVLDYASLMLNLERIPGVTIHTVRLS